MRQRLRRSQHDDAPLLPADTLAEQTTTSAPIDTTSAALRRSVTPPAPVLRGALPRLQSVAGNRAVQRLVSPSTQRHAEGPHDLPLAQEDEEFTVPDVRIPPAGTGRQIPSRFRTRLEDAFNVDFSQVRVREGQTAGQLGAIAYTRGMDIEFARGHYSPHTGSGRRLLAHELAHVVQQQARRVPIPRAEDIPDAAFDAGVPVNNDRALEAEASRQGRRAAWDLPARVAGQRLTVSRPMLPVVQSSPIGRLASPPPRP